MLNSTFMNLDETLKDKKSSFCLAAFLIIDILAITFNIILIKAIYSRKHSNQTRTHIYMTFVSCANLGVAFFVLPFTIATLIAGKWVFGTGMFGYVCCYVSGFSIIFWFTLTIYSMTALSLHNYMAIAHPMFRPDPRKVTPCCIGPVIITSLAVSAASLAYDKVRFEPSIGQCTTFDMNGEKAYFTACLTFLLCFVLPTCINAIACYKALKSLCEGAVWSKTNSINSERSIESKRHVTKTLRLAFGVYMFCWVPLLVHFIVYVILPPGEHRYYIRLRQAAMVSGFLSSVLNPLIYIVRNRLYKRLYNSISRKVSTFIAAKRGSESEGSREQSVSLKIVK